MKIAIYSPYLDTAGGGEKYILSIAETLASESRVDILLDQHLKKIGVEEIIRRNSTRHNIDFSRIHFLEAPIGTLWSSIKRALFFRKYDFLFYLTDGSIFFATAKKNIVHFQVPFENTRAKGIWGGLKLKSWNLAIYNSKFTKENVEKSWPIKGQVIYPPVDVSLFKPLTKKKQIISVGRFFGYDRAKKHELLIDIFQKMVSEGLNDWSLHLAGGVGKGDAEYLGELKEIAKGFKVFFYPNIPLDRLIKLYGSSQIYWHAAGFGETDPKKFEHFGISTVEAMSAGCIPIVINLGGQKEIVEDRVSGFLWDQPIEMNQLTLNIIKKPKLKDKIAKAAIKRSEKFSKEKFQQNIYNLVYGGS